ncbi:MAG: hypothetical protein JWQ09_4799 [Segetibacter sp.]|nr:hypothetical protein [Segetibacter sp.]
MENKSENFVKVCLVISLLYATLLILFAYGFFSGIYNYFDAVSIKTFFGSIVMSILIYIFISWPWIASYRLARSKVNETRVMIFIFLTLGLSSLLFFGKSYGSDNPNGFIFVMFSWSLYPVTRLFSRNKKI